MTRPIPLAAVLALAVGCGGAAAVAPAQSDAAAKAAVSADGLFFAGKLAEALPELAKATADGALPADLRAEFFAKLAAAKAAAGDAAGAKADLAKADEGGCRGAYAAYADGYLKLKSGDKSGAQKAFAAAKQEEPRLAIPDAGK